MIYIGNHLSSSKGFLAMGKMALKLGGDTFAFFTRNPRGGAAKAIDPEDAAKLVEFMKDAGYDISKNHYDCGLLIYDRIKQDMHAGGSGCGCSAVVLASHFLEKLKNLDYKRILFMATGAMMSPTSLMQGLSIPGIAHLLRIEMMTK